MPVNERDLREFKRLRAQARSAPKVPKEVYQALRVLRRIHKIPTTPRRVIFTLDGIEYTFPEKVPPLALKEFAERMADGQDKLESADFAGLLLIRPIPGGLDAADMHDVLELLYRIFIAEWRRHGIA